jgi:nucleotide-binding universal stress UspA family protein
MSAVKSILLHVDATPDSVERLGVTRALASQHGARVTALFGASWDSERMSYAYSAGAALQAQASDPDESAREEARNRLQSCADEVGSNFTWCEAVGEFVKPAFLAEAVYADLLVVGQRPPESAAGAAPGGLVESAILASGRPTLILPRGMGKEGVGRCVLVAWDGSVPAARAVTGALPFLERAQEVHVVSWASHPPHAPFSRVDVGEFLLRHGIKATLHQRAASSHVATELEALAGTLNTDLVVMGCYGHSRVSERIFGGTSRSALAGLPMPLLMMH